MAKSDYPTTAMVDEPPRNERQFQTIRLNVQALNGLGVVHKVRLLEKREIEIELEIIDRAPLLTNEARDTIRGLGGPAFAEMLIASLERQALNALVGRLLTNRE